MRPDFRSVEEARLRARRCLPRSVFEFVDGGADDEISLRANLEALARWRLLPRPLSAAAERDQACELFGLGLTQPVLIAPTGFAGIVHPRGELAAARAAAAAGTVYVVSHGSTVRLEELAAAVEPRHLWFQLFLFRDRAVTARFCARAKAAGCGALVVTIDNQVSGNREKDRRNGFSVPPRLRLRTAVEAALRPRWLARMAKGGTFTAANYTDEGGDSILKAGQRITALLDPGVTWEDVRWLRRAWDGPLLVKGILRADGVGAAQEAGVDGLIVSNHGGRQLDGVPAAADMLPRIVDAAAGRMPVLMDGGVRRGTDVLKAIALGASAVLIGRPHLWGLAVAGEAGVARVLAVLKEETDRAMALGGWPDLAALGRDDLWRDGA